jgi:hypothetical protein
MKKFLSFLIVITVFCWSVVAQDIGSVQKRSDFSVPEKIQGPLGDPLPAGTYSIGSGGDFPTIDSAFNKLSIDGISGAVTLELIDNLYTAPTENFGFLLTGPIVGAGENSRVIIKPAQNHQVTIEGNGGSVLYFSNTSYVTLDGVALTGPTTLTINSFNNSQFTWNDGVDFVDDSDNNIVTNTNFNDEDVGRPSTAIGFWTNSSGAIGAPDNNLIENNNIIQGTFAIYVSAAWSNVFGFNNIIRNNLISAPSGFNISWGIQLEKNENTIIENNVVNNIINSGANLELAFGINAHWCNSCTIRNNIVHSISSNVRNGSTGILLSGIAGKEGYDNMIYNNMIFDIQSTSANPISRITGIQIWHNHNPKVYYNSIHLSGTGSNYLGSAALFIRTNTTNIEACDNIFVNTRDESPYCATSIYLYTSPTILTSDYNDLYYQPGQYNCLVRASGGDYYNLQEWQATGHDMYSISEMPNFTDLLHIDESIPNNLESGATPILGIDTDFDGDLRHPTKPDIGADEFEGMTLDTLYVPGDYSTIQAAIDAAINGNVVLVAEGTYYENINYKGKAITVASHFLIDGNETHIENTIIDGSQPIDPDFGSVVLFISGEDTNSVLCGFTITGGTGTYDPYPGRFGGGIGFSNSGAQIKNNIIEFNTLDNTSLAYGGGIYTNYSNNSNIIIKNNTIQNNTCNGTDYACGAGIKITTNGYALISNNKILQNAVSAGIEATGGGIECFGPINEVYIVNNYIKGNTVQTNYNGGGGIDIYECTTNTPVLENNIIVGNYSNLYGGGVEVDLNLDEQLKPGGIKTPNTTESDNLLTPVFFANNTIVNNTAGVSGGGIHTNDMTSDIMNSIIWGNTAPANSQISGTVNVVYSDVEGGWTGEGNINVNPLFSDTLFHLSDSSPCIGTGIESIDIGGTMYYCPPFCYYGNPRPNPSGSMPDIGACESPLPNPVGVENALSQIPDDYSLSQNYPNPFNPTTTMVYGLRERTNVELKLFDVLGREVETIFDGEQNAGFYEVEFNASTLASGIYFYRLQAGDYIETKKMVLMK